MRKQPLLALASTTIALSTAGVAAGETGTPHQASTPQLGLSHLPAAGADQSTSASDGSPATPATLVTDLRTTTVARSFTAAVHGDYALAAISFAVRGDRVLGTWQTPAERLFARQRALIARHRELLARQHAAALARLRRLVARRRAALRAAVARRAARLASIRRLAAQRAARRASVYRPASGVWASLRQCESGGNYAIDTGNGYYGAYQFSVQTWQGLGFTGLPSSAPPAMQDRAAQMLESQRGWSPWPVCSVVLGLR